MRYWVSIYNLGRPSATIITDRGVVYNHWLQRERCTNKQPRVDAITWQRTCVQFFLFGRLAHIFTSQRRNSCRFPTFFVCQVTRFHLLRHKIKKEKKTHSLIYAEHFFTFYLNSCSLSTTTSERKSQLVLLLLLFYYSRRCNKPKRRNKKKWIIFVFERPRSVLASSKIRRYTLCVTNYILLHAVCRCVWRLFNLWVKKEKI